MVAARIGLWLALAAWPAMAVAQSPGPTEPQLDQAVLFGGIAAVTPLCNLRDQAWAADLRRAELQAMGVELRPQQADPARQQQADLAGAALSYAEDEALESFAAGPPDAVCAKLAEDPNLKRADRIVAAFRVHEGKPAW